MRALIEALLVSVSALSWLWGVYAIGRTLRAIPKLKSERYDPPEVWPRLSLIIPARDEEEEVEDALRARLGEGYPALEVIAVDDRSTDATGAILDRIAAEDPRVKVIHIDALPEGWLGKVYAMHRGIEAATGEWILLSDADVHFVPGTLERVIATCCARRLDHFAALPTFRPRSLLLDAVIDVFGRNLLLSGRLWSVEDPTSNAAVGGGLFNLMRREAYERSPGLEWLRLEVADDVALAQMLKAHGARTAVYDTVGMVSLDFYRSVGAFVRGVEKNAFAVIGRFSLPRLTLTSALILVIEFGWIAGLGSAHGGLRVAALLVGLTAFATTGVAIAGMGRSLRTLPLIPVATIIFVFAAMRAGILSVVRGGVAWRGTVYPVEALRRGARLRIP